MSNTALLETLRSLHFFHDVPDKDLLQIVPVAQLDEHAAGVALFREGENVARIFFVVEGSVGLELPVPGRGAKRILTVGRGELLGWSPLLGPMPMTATARTLVPTRVVAVDAGQVLALCHHDPKFGFEFMRRTAMALAKRLQATRLQLLDVFMNELPEVSDLPGRTAR